MLRKLKLRSGLTRVTNLDSLPVLKEIPTLGKGACAVERARVITASGAIDELYVLGIVRQYGDERSTVVVCARVKHTDECDTGLVVLTSQLYTCPINAIKVYDRVEAFKKSKPLDHYLPSGLR